MWQVIKTESDFVSCSGLRNLHKEMEYKIGDQEQMDLR